MCCAVQNHGSRSLATRLRPINFQMPPLRCRRHRRRHRAECQGRLARAVPGTTKRLHVVLSNVHLIMLMLSCMLQFCYGSTDYPDEMCPPLMLKRTDPCVVEILPRQSPVKLSLSKARTEVLVLQTATMLPIRMTRATSSSMRGPWYSFRPRM